MCNCNNECDRDDMIHEDELLEKIDWNDISDWLSYAEDIDKLLEISKECIEKVQTLLEKTEDSLK